MKVRILDRLGSSKSKTYVFTDRIPTGFDREITSLITANVTAEAVNLSRNVITRMASAIKAAAINEAYLLLVYANKILEGGFNEVRGPDISPTGVLGARVKSLTGASPDGRVPWQELSRAYWLRKSLHFPQNTDKLLVRTGVLSRYLLREKTSIIENRFGGIKVNVTPVSGLAKRDLTVFDRDVDARNVASSYKTILGHIQVQIFPKISAALLPGLSSRRWTETGGTNGAFERAYLPPGAALKLAGGGPHKSVPYRPLILPLTQFWMLVRIPAAIATTVQRFSKSITIKENG